MRIYKRPGNKYQGSLKRELFLCEVSRYRILDTTSLRMSTTRNFRTAIWRVIKALDITGHALLLQMGRILLDGSYILRLEKCERFSDYDGLEFGYVNGAETAFLIQNVRPVTEECISNIYTIEKGTVEVTINEDTADKIKRKVRKVILMLKKNIRITLTNISRILAELPTE